MHDTAGLTVSQKILLAAADLEARGFVPFTAAALTIAAWKIDAKTFGLRGFEAAHPDNNRVECCVMGERGLARRGWLVKVGQKLYQLSRQGKDEAGRIRSGDGSEVSLPKRRALMKIQVPRDLETQLVALFTTTAFRRYEEGMKREITYRDACRFWGMADNATGDAVDQQLSVVPRTLAAVEQCLVGYSVELSNGQSVNAEDLKSLGSVHHWLVTQFARNLHQQRERRGRF
jgi:hypothetical protein